MASQGTEWEEHLFDVVNFLSSFFFVTQIAKCTSGEVRPHAHNSVVVTSAPECLESGLLVWFSTGVINILSELVH